MTTDEQAKLLKQANARLFIGIISVLVISALMVFVLTWALRTAGDDASRVERDGIACLLEQLNEHRQNTFAVEERDADMRGEASVLPAPPPASLPPELVATCARFLQAPK